MAIRPYKCHRVLTTVCLHVNLKAYAACDLNFTVKGEGLLIVIGSVVHWKSDNIWEMVLDSYVVPCNNRPITGTDTRMSYLIATMVKTLSVLEGHSPIACFFECNISYLWHFAHSLCICRASS